MKIKKIVKCSVSLILAVLFVAQSVPALARTQSSPLDGIMHHEVLDMHGNIIEQIFEQDGSVFTFRMTDEYTYSSQLTALGTYNFGFRHNNSNAVLAGDFVLLDKSVLLNIAEIGDFATGRAVANPQMHMSISSLIMSNLDEFVTEIIEFDIHESLEPEPTDAEQMFFSGVDPRAAAHLRTLGHHEQNFRLINSTFQDGYVASLHQTVRFSRVLQITLPQILVSFLSATAATVVSAVLGIPKSAVGNIVRLVMTAGGTWIVAALTHVSHQDINVTNERAGVVNNNNVVRFIQTNTMRYRILFGDIGVDHNRIHFTHFDIICPHFHNQTFIMQEAIRRHRLNIWTTW